LTRFLSIAAAGAALALAGCGGGDDDSEPTSAGGETATTATAPPTEADAAAKPTGTTLELADSQYGSILFDADDQAIYLFDKEAGPKAECYGACAEAWPPVLTEGEPRAAAGAMASLLGTTERTDGTTQVTYAGHPLYYYAHEGPGQVLCHNVEEFGGLWLVVERGGEAVS
jgi:predicted lipoprotein with Yx(FWY)xxD motif